jgi:hypothetical protein
MQDLRQDARVMQLFLPGQLHDCTCMYLRHLG